MINSGKIKQVIILLGDLVILYGSLFLMLLLRFGPEVLNARWKDHVAPFSVLFIAWILSFYIFGLYRYKIGKNTDITKNLFLAVVFGSVASVLSLYFFEIFFGMTPRLNIIIFVALVFGLKYLWQKLVIFNLFTKKTTKIVVLGSSELVSKTVDFVKDNPHIGYEIIEWIKDPKDKDKLEKELKDLQYEMLVVCGEVPLKTWRENRNITSFWQFYEDIFEKIPTEEIKDGWFASNISRERPVYETSKKVLDKIMALILLIVLSPIILTCLILIKLTSRGPAMFNHKRVGKNGKKFTIYKMRSMVENAEKDGPKWAKENDKRVTTLGRFLRKTHIDELPQLINILKGDISFVGPRPERPEFVKTLEKKISFYNARHAIRPGITGWAQIRYKYGSSIEDTKEKLQYDLYYLKNRNIFMDIKIILKTIRMFFVSNN